MNLPSDIVKVLETLKTKHLLDLLLLRGIVGLVDMVEMRDHAVDILAAVCRHALDHGDEVPPLFRQ